MAEDGAEVVLEGITRRHPGENGRPPHVAVSSIELAVKRGELMVLVGPSGCGKSTTLRMVAGLDDPDEGKLLIGGRSMRGVPPQDRDVAMVFQGYALYPHMTAREILEFPLKMRKVAAAERARAVDEAASLLGIGRLLDRRPDQMSGGERQRVAMGRAIVRKPRVFLFDEPLSNLDAALRGDIRIEIGNLVRRLGATALYVTHDQVEAMTLADRIAVMRGGKILQVASPRDLYERPSTSFVGTFLGSPKMNLLRAKSSPDGLVAGPFVLPRPRGALPAEVEVGVRPEHVRIDRGGAQATVIAVEPLGAETHLVLEAAGIRLFARVPGFQTPERGSNLGITLESSALHVFDPERDGARIDA
jgi:multiple sugar transport system ATP-binding protein